MSDEDLIAKLMKAHYRLMARKDFWYNARIREGSKILCVMASNLRLRLRNEKAN